MPLTEKQRAALTLVATIKTRVQLTGRCRCHVCKSKGRTDGHVFKDEPEIKRSAARIARVFGQWEKLVQAEIVELSSSPRRRTHHLIRRLLQPIKKAAAPLNTSDASLIVGAVFGPDGEARAGDLARERLLGAIDGYKAGTHQGKAYFDNLDTSFPGLTAEIRDSILNDMLVFSDKTLARVNNSVRDEILASIVRGDSVNELQTAIGDLFGGLQEYESLRIARTEYARFQIRGKAAVFLSQGVKYAQVSAAPDACPICAGYNGRIFPVDEIAKYFPFHPNCRCDIIPAEDPDPKDVETDPPYSVFEDPELQDTPWETLDAEERKARVEEAGLVSTKEALTDQFLDALGEAELPKAVANAVEVFTGYNPSGTEMDARLANLRPLQAMEFKSVVDEDGSTGLYHTPEHTNAPDSIYIKSGRSVSDMQGTVIHEYAHHIDFAWMQSSEASLLSAGMSLEEISAAPIDETSLAVARSKMVKEWDTAAGKILKEIGSKGPMNYQTWKAYQSRIEAIPPGGVSHYSVATIHEWFAESFMAYWDGNQDLVENFPNTFQLIDDLVKGEFFK